jgi:hypothetical protein
LCNRYELWSSVQKNTPGPIKRFDKHLHQTSALPIMVQ